MNVRQREKLILHHHRLKAGEDRSLPQGGGYEDGQGKQQGQGQIKPFLHTGFPPI